MTQKEIAEKLNITQAAVSMALKDSSRISPELKETVRKLAADTGYRYNLAGQTLRKGKSNIIGVLFPRSTNLFYAELYQELYRQLAPRGYMPYLIPSETYEARCRSIETLRQFCVSGVVGIGSHSDHNAELLQLQKEGVAVVLEGGNPHPERGISQVIPELYPALTALMNHLINSGRRKIVLLAPENMDSARRSAYTDAMTEAGLPVRTVTLQDVDYMETGYRTTLKLFEDMPDTDAVFAYNDELAIAAKRAIIRSGRRIPDDVALAGVDNISIGAYLSPPLTTVEQPIKEIAAAIADELFAIFKTPSRHTLRKVPCNLVLRSST